jgi:hypothetical protein
MSQPRPVVTAAKIISAVAILLGLIPMVGTLTALWVWNADQLVAYTAVSGGVIAAASTLFGVQAEKMVTPVESPRDDDGVPFVPIALDAYED